MEEFDWDEANISHLAVHRVTPSEFEQVIRNGPLELEIQLDEMSSEQRVVEIGHTNSLRVLIVIWTPRGELIRAVTAFGPSREQREEYLVNFYGE